MSASRPPLPPFTRETAIQKLQQVDDSMNSGDPAAYVAHFSPDSEWRSGETFITGQHGIRTVTQAIFDQKQELRTKSWYFAHGDNTIASNFQCEYHNADGNWYRTYGSQHLTFNDEGYITRRDASLNNLPIDEDDRLIGSEHEELLRNGTHEGRPHNHYHPHHLSQVRGAEEVSEGQPMKLVDNVEIPKFMGDWYVISCIPTPFETTVYNAIEHYELNSDDTVKVEFTYNDGSFEAKRKKVNAKGFPDKEERALWGMQFMWPFKADYRIVYLEPDYSVTIVGRKKRDYVWIMAREPHMSADKYAHLTSLVKSWGYDLTQMREVPQKWE